MRENSCNNANHSDLPALQYISFGGESFRYSHLVQFESMDGVIDFIMLDLPKLTTILFNESYTLRGDWRDQRKTVINGHESYDNTLIMKSMLKLKLKLKLKLDLIGYDNCIDLPSLTRIQGQENCYCVHFFIGRVILESMF